MKGGEGGKWAVSGGGGGGCAEGEGVRWKGETITWVRHRNNETQA